MLEQMKLSNIKTLKEFSWYLLFPSFSCAMVIENINEAPILKDNNYGILWEWFLFVGVNIFTISIFIFLFFIIFFGINGFLIAKFNFRAFTLILATVVLSFSSVGIMIYWIQIENIILPINQLWFISFVILSFNLYQLDDNQQSKE